MILTKEEIKILELIKQDNSYKNHFFKNVSKIRWYWILKSEGYFQPGENPFDDEGNETKFWMPLIFLEKISKNIKDGNELQLVEELLSIIRIVSENPKDNYRTWSSFIKILSDLPNERIPLEILNYIPTWLLSKFDTLLQSYEICEKLLPKFLSENPTKDDILKAELILTHLFTIDKLPGGKEKVSDKEKPSYYSKVYLHALTKTLIEEGLITKVVTFCSNSLVFELANSLKKLLLDYPKGLKFTAKHKDKEYEFYVFIDGKNLSIQRKHREDKSLNDTLHLENYEDFNDVELRIELIKLLNKNGKYFWLTEENEKELKQVIYLLRNDLTSSFRINTIAELGDKYYAGDKVIDVFAWIFRTLLNEKVKQHWEEGLRLLRQIYFNNFYRLPFFKRIILYIISEHWQNLKPLFWEIVKENDPTHLFSFYKYERELFSLLEKNQEYLKAEEITRLDNIVNNGPQDERFETDQKYPDYWRLRWYAALNKIEPFKTMYLKFSKEFNRTAEDFRTEGEIKFRSGSVPPISMEALLKMENKEVAQYLKTFQPTGKWEDPTISGLSEILGKAVQKAPDKFSENLDVFIDIYYIYAYRILNGFQNAWKDKVQNFNWEKVLNFCKDYINSQKFLSDELILQNDGWGVKPDWITGAIAELLTEGMRSDEKAFEEELLPLAKEIIVAIAKDLKVADDNEKALNDYVTYSLNSKEGKVLRALFDYSLRTGRLQKAKGENIIWEKDIKALFEASLDKGIIDAYVLQGMYFEQFSFLDQEWIITKVKKYYDLEQKLWLGFINGLVFSKPAHKVIYPVVKPHFIRAVNEKVEFKSFPENGLIYHLVSFYFWGYEVLEENGLIKKFIDNSNPKLIDELVSFIWRQKEYLKTISDKEAEGLKIKIVGVWKYIVNKFERICNKEEEKLVAGLIRLIAFIPELNEENTNLIIKSTPYIKQNYYDQKLVKNLMFLKQKGDVALTAKYIGKILMSTTFNSYSKDHYKNEMIELVSFLFENDQKEAASEFCNKMVRQEGNEYLREVYKKYMS